VATASFQSPKAAKVPLDIPRAILKTMKSCPVADVPLSALLGACDDH